MNILIVKVSFKTCLYKEQKEREKKKMEKAIEKALSIYKWENRNTIEKIIFDSITNSYDVYFSDGCIYYYFE